MSYRTILSGLVLTFLANSGLDAQEEPPAKPPEAVEAGANQALFEERKARILEMQAQEARARDEAIAEAARREAGEREEVVAKAEAELRELEEQARQARQEAMEQIRQAERQLQEARRRLDETMRERSEPLEEARRRVAEARNQGPGMGWQPQRNVPGMMRRFQVPRGAGPGVRFGVAPRAGLAGGELEERVNQLERKLDAVLEELKGWRAGSEKK